MSVTSVYKKLERVVLKLTEADIKNVKYGTKCDLLRIDALR